jgi:hypothetical protein
MIRVLPDYYPRNGNDPNHYRIINPALVETVWECYSTKKDRHICLYLDFSSGASMTIQNLLQRDWESIYWSNHYGKWMFPLDHKFSYDQSSFFQKKSEEIDIDETLRPIVK